MENQHEKFIKRCYELAISAGKKGYDTFGAVLVSDNKIIKEAKNNPNLCEEHKLGIFIIIDFISYERGDP